MRKKKGEPMRYKVLTLVWSIQHSAYFQAGEVIEFDLSEAAEHKPDIERLIEMGAIEPYTGPWPLPLPEPENPEEVTNA